jgi:hypothetical protein
MKFRDHKGYFYTIIYYLFGFLLSYIIYLIFGWEYMHAPGLHHLTFILFLIGGIIWSLFDLILLIRKKAKFYKESLIVHSTIMVALIIWIFTAYFMVEIPNIKHDDVRNNSITLTKRNDTSISISAKNDTIYLKIKDSIYVDRMKDSILMDSIMNK